MPAWLIVALRLTGLGWYVALCIVFGILGGLWLGNLTGQVALLTLLGVTLGSVVAFYGVYRMVLPAIYGSKSKRETGTPPPAGSGEQSDHGGNGY